MEKRYDLSMVVSNGKGCGYIEHKTFIGENIALEDVKKFIRKNAVENKELDIKYIIFEGWGMEQKKVWEIKNWIYN